MDIFISSGTKNLQAERRAVEEQILDLADRPIGMEHFGASPEPALDECLSQLADADLMVLILGPAYGSIHADTGISYTENEYRYARKIGIPVLGFATGNLDQKILMENDSDSTKKYQAFVNSVRGEIIYSEFRNPHQLAARVSAAIANYKSKHGELGRRLNPFASAQEYYSSLLDPTKYFNHTWQLAGRKDVLVELQQFISGSATVGTLYGPGGLGKSKILYEFGKSFDEQTSGWNLRFLRAAIPLSSDFARGLPAGRCVLILDDAHRYPEQLETALTLLSTQQYAKRTKFILAARPSGSQIVKSIVGRSADASEITELGNLASLSSVDARALAAQSLGPADAIYVDDLVRAASKSPLVIAVGGRLIHERNLHPKLLVSDNDFRRAVLDRYADEVTTVLGTPAEPWRELLVVLAALGSVRTADPQFRQRASDFLNMKPWELVERIGVLEQNGLLSRRGGLVEIAPDVLADHLLQSACVSAHNEDTGRAMPLFENFAGISAAGIFRNLGELQWRINQLGGQPQILSGLWSYVRQEFAAADYGTRVQILKMIRDTAAYQPADAIRIVREAIELN